MSEERLQVCLQQWPSIYWLTRRGRDTGTRLKAGAGGVGIKASELLLVKQKEEERPHERTSTESKAFWKRILTTDLETKSDFDSQFY